MYILKWAKIFWQSGILNAWMPSELWEYADWNVLHIVQYLKQCHLSRPLAYNRNDLHHQISIEEILSVSLTYAWTQIFFPLWLEPQIILHWLLHWLSTDRAVLLHWLKPGKRWSWSQDPLGSPSLWIGLVYIGTIGSILVYITGQGSAGGIPHTEGFHTKTWFILKTFLTNPPSFHFTWPAVGSMKLSIFFSLSQTCPGVNNDISVFFVFCQIEHFCHYILQRYFLS